MIEEVTELSGAASPLTPAPTQPADAATSDASEAAEKPKRRRVTKKADAELPLEGIEAPEKPRRAPRKKKTDDTTTDATATNATVTNATATDAMASVGEAAPEKPKRVTRRKKTDETGESADTATAPVAAEESAASAVKSRAKSADKTTGEAGSARSVAVLEQEINSGPAPLRMAPAAAMGSFSPSPAQAEIKANEFASDHANSENNARGEQGESDDARSERGNNARSERGERTRREQSDNARGEVEARSERSDNARGEAKVETRNENGAQTRGEAKAPDTNGDNGEAQTRGEESDGNSDDDDFRNRLSYRDRRAMRREQRIVARGNRDEEPEAETNSEPRARSNRDNNRDNNRDGETRDNDNRGNDRNNRGDRNDNRGERGDNRNDRNNRGDRNNNRNDNRGERTNRGERNNNRGERNDNRNDRNERQDNRAEREPRENRRERNGSRGREYDLTQLQEMDGEALMAVVAELNMEEAPGDKEALLYAILEAQAHAQNAILKKGILDILPDGKGFMRCENYYPSEGDVYVSQTQIKRFGLKTGDQVLGTARIPKENERYHGLLRVESINGLSIEESRGRLNFEKLTPIFPTERFPLETDAANITARIIDLVSPIGKGQRGLIVAPPKAGKTTLIKNIANSITENNPEVILFVLLIDERPEEVTDISRSVRGEVVASTFDEVPENHIRVADIVMERAKRLVEQGSDVVVLLDSITRLSRASNLVVAPSGRTMSGGLDPAAMYKPKRHFGAARNIENGGSLTVLATVLVDTGSRMDEYIFEELKGTGNLDLVLDRDLFNQRIFPAIDINRSGTRRDDLLLNPEELAATFHLRRTLAALDNDKAVTLLIDRLKNTKSNANFMEVVAKSQRNQPA